MQFLFPRDAPFYRALFLFISIASIINKIIPSIQKTKLDYVYRSFGEVLPIKTKLAQYCGLIALPSAIAMQSSFVYASALSFDKTSGTVITVTIFQYDEPSKIPKLILKNSSDKCFIP